MLDASLGGTFRLAYSETKGGDQSYLSSYSVPSIFNLLLLRNEWGCLWKPGGLS